MRKDVYKAMIQFPRKMESEKESVEVMHFSYKRKRNFTDQRKGLRFDCRTGVLVSVYWHDGTVGVGMLN